MAQEQQQPQDAGRDGDRDGDGDEDGDGDGDGDSLCRVQDSSASVCAVRGSITLQICVN